MKEKLVPIYNRLEAIYARKGKRSLWPNQRFVHDFKAVGTRVLGVRKGGMYKLNPGDLIIRSSRGKRLWKYFDYPVR